MSVWEGAEPFGFDGGEAGVLLIHGYTGSPQGLREWGEYLASEGFTVLCPRLPGHATTLQDLAGSTSKQWVEEAEMALRGLRERCSTIFIGALSFGATIGLDLAARYPDTIHGMALVNASVYNDDPRVKLAPVLGKMNLFLKGLGNDVADPGQTELCYPKISTKATKQVLDLMAHVHANLDAVRCPLLLFVSQHDHVVPPGNTRRVYERVASTEKEIVTLPRSYHVATLDYDRRTIFEQSAQFFRDHSKE